MIEYVVEGRTFGDRHDAKRHAEGLASSARRPVYVAVFVDSERFAWWYGGPAGLEAYRRTEGGPTRRVEVDRIAMHPEAATLD